MTEERPLAAAYEAQPIIEAMILIFEREKFDEIVLSVQQVQNLIVQYFSTQPSTLAIAESFDEGSRLGLWALIGKIGEPNHIEVRRNVITLHAGALRSQADSTLHALEKVGASHLQTAIRHARREAEEDNGDSPPLNKLSASLKRLEHNYIFQRGLEATKQGRKSYYLPTSEKRKDSSIDWSKSSAIATWLGVAIAIIAIIVTFLVSK